MMDGRTNGTKAIYIFGGMKILWICFWGHQQIGLYLGVISMHFRVFLKVKGTELRIFFGFLKFQIFWSTLEYSGVNQVITV